MKPGRGDNHVLIVGAGLLGAWTAYWLSRKRGISTVLIDQDDPPNPAAESAEFLKPFRLSSGGDSFMTAMAAKAAPLWRDLGSDSEGSVLEESGFLELSSRQSGPLREDLRILRELSIPAEDLEREALHRRFSMLGLSGVRFAVFHPGGGILWARRGLSTLLASCQKAGVRLSPRVAAKAVLRDGSGNVAGIRTAEGSTLKAKSYLFAAGAWAPGLLDLKGWRVPVKVMRQRQLYLRPPVNRGRYRPGPFPVLDAAADGFICLPLHIRGYMKLIEPPRSAAKAGELGDGEDVSFVGKCRAFLKRRVPEIAGFTEWECSRRAVGVSRDSRAVVDRLPGASNAFVACGLGQEGAGLSPLLGKALAELLVGAKPAINLHRFRINR